jgi:hypothetical protein
MAEFYEDFKKDTLEKSELIKSVRKAKEEVYKGAELIKTVPLQYVKLDKKILKPITKFLLKDYDYISLEDITVVITDNKFIKYVQIEFTEDADDDMSDYKPYIRLYREKVFKTYKTENKKSKNPKRINVSEELTKIDEPLQEFRKHLFKAIYRIIFNTYPENSKPNENQFKRRIIFD